MVEGIIVVAPRFDEVTEYCFEESRDLIKYAKKEKVKIYDLPDEQAIRENLEKETKLHPEALIYHTDHGSPDKAWGDDERPVLDLKNVKVLASKEAFMNNCSSAKELGVKAYQNGCLAYWGNTDIVGFTTDAWETFKEAFLYGLKLRIQGYNWAECLKKTKEKVTQLIDKLLTEGKILAAAFMRSFRDTLVCYTPETPPQDSGCAARRLAIRLFGCEVGWKISRTVALGWLFSLSGWGITLHAIANELYWKGGYTEILKAQGEWIGLGLNLIGFILITWQNVKWLRALKS